MLYVKALHLLAIISWMAGIFYLPRIFVHYVEGKAAGEDVRRLKVMARRLYHFTSIMAVFALASGLWLGMMIGFQGRWLHAKMGVVLLLVAYHISMRVFMKRMQREAPLPGATALRWYNEVPLLLLLAILWLVVLKPF
jgi:putative membrane protein